MSRRVWSSQCAAVITAWSLQITANSADPAELSKLRTDYFSRLEAATKPVQSWYLLELNRLQKLQTMRGDVQGALVQRERDTIEFIGTKWTWQGRGYTGTEEVFFRSDGRGKHTNGSSMGGFRATRSHPHGA